MAQCMLSTSDNPYNPFEDFDAWYAYDEALARKEGRASCCSYLAKMSLESDDVSEKEDEEINEMVIDDIIALNLGGKFIKVTKNTPVSAKEGS